MSGILTPTVGYTPGPSLDEAGVNGDVYYYDTWADAPTIEPTFIENVDRICARFNYEFKLYWNGYGRYWYVNHIYEGQETLGVRLLDEQSQPLPLDNRALAKIENSVIESFNDFRRKMKAKQDAQEKVAAEHEEHLIRRTLDGTERAFLDGASVEHSARIANEQALETVAEIHGDAAAASAEAKLSSEPHYTDKITTIGNYRTCEVCKTPFLPKKHNEKGCSDMCKKILKKWRDAKRCKQKGK